jgi:prepilin peptidase CpaA
VDQHVHEDHKRIQRDRRYGFLIEPISGIRSFFEFPPWLFLSNAMPPLSLLIRLVTACMLLWLAATDIRERRLPNKMVVVVGALFFIDAVVIHLSFSDLLMHLLTAVVVYLICAVLFAAKMLGGGDAKLAAVIFLWTGISLSGPAAILISVVGGVVAVASLITRKTNPSHRLAAVRVLAMFSGARGVPYGVALALGGGTVIVLPALLPLLLTQ